MARPNKAGIDYFPFDIDFFNDEKIQFTSARFGLKGEIIAIRLLCKIYRNGYYTEWNDDTALLFAKGVGDGVQDSCVKDVVYELLKRGFFDRSIFDKFGILTSRGIQARYFEATKRYKSVEAIKEYLLIDVSKMDNVNINGINDSINDEKAYINSQKKRKGKVKENTTPLTPQTGGEKTKFEKFNDWLKENCESVTKMEKQLTEDQFAVISEKYSSREIASTIQSMDNWKKNGYPVNKLRKSVFQTFNSWKK